MTVPYIKVNDPTIDIKINNKRLCVMSCDTAIFSIPLYVNDKWEKLLLFLKEKGMLD